MKHELTYIPGDGVSERAGEAVLEILAKAGVDISWDIQHCGKKALKEHDVPVPPPLVLSLKKNKIALKGKCNPLDEGEFNGKNPTVILRQVLDLYCNVRPIKNVRGLKSLYDALDSVVIRQATEGIYTGLEHEIAPGIVESVKVTTEKAAVRIAEFAFAYAKNNNRRKVTTIHKANIMKKGDGLFLHCSQEVAKQYPSIAHNHIIVDNCCMQMVMKPHQFDILLVENLYGDIVADLGSGIAGGISASAGVSLNDEIFVFESGHAQTKELVRDEMTNPLTVLTASLLMLRHIGETAAAESIENAVQKTLEEGVRTPDIGGGASMRQMTESICRHLNQL